jgi:hypothetical protein
MLRLLPECKKEVFTSKKYGPINFLNKFICYHNIGMLKMETTSPGDKIIIQGKLSENYLLGQSYLMKGEGKWQVVLGDVDILNNKKNINFSKVATLTATW